MKVLGIILARAGSERLPGKNKLPLCGKPLICYTLDTALKSNVLDTVVVSTDDEDIKRICKRYQPKYGNLVILDRPEELAGPHVPSEACMLQVMSEMDKHDYVMLLQPTSPLRTVMDIRSVLFLTKNHDCIVSVNQKTEAWNGALFICEWNKFIKNKGFSDPALYYMSNKRSIDIDTEEDLREAARLIRRDR